MHVKVDVYSGLAIAMLIIGMSGIETAANIPGLNENDRDHHGSHGNGNHYRTKPGAAVNHAEVFQYA